VMATSITYDYPMRQLPRANKPPERLLCRQQQQLENWELYADEDV
jgi:hypothetical protein